MDSESSLISFISQLMAFSPDSNSGWDSGSELISLTIQIISFVNSMNLDSLKPKLRSLVSQAISVSKSMDLDSQPKPFSELISVIKRTISLFESLDLYSEPNPLLKLKSLITQKSSLLNFVELDWDFISPVDQSLSLRPKPNSDLNVMSLFEETMSLEPKPELISLIHQIISLLMYPKPPELISLCPQLEVRFEADGKFHVTGKPNNDKGDCLSASWDMIEGEEDTHFLCKGCYGRKHESYEKAPVKIKHRLHPKHSLQLVCLEEDNKTRKCYCGDENLLKVFYYCPACDFAINIVCVEKPSVLSIDCPKWHEHTLAHFPRHASLTCDMCALVDSSSPFYTCLSCDFVVHQSCLSLPRVIRISRHFHRISFTFSFKKGDWCCGICRRKIDNDYGGYSCLKECCAYAAHSKCATQRNVWDGKDLEGEPEEIEEVPEPPFVRISDGIIQHFSHQHHYLRLDENTGRDYDEDKQCEACVMPIYFGNFYSCMQMQCDYILHETCANLSRKIHHPIHPHLLTLVGGNVDVMNYIENHCSACPRVCTTGFFYECGEGECDFQLDVKCATISEPLVNESHMHPLFLTSKPEERRTCKACKELLAFTTHETFNCIDCDFGLCFNCATLPQIVSYKHDKHMLTLSYGEEASTMTYWCEVCEEKVDTNERFYTCAEYCCVTLHINCLIGKDFYMKAGSSYYMSDRKVSILANNHLMSRPICSHCKLRCPYRIVFQHFGMKYCSVICTCCGEV